MSIGGDPTFARDALNSRKSFIFRMSEHDFTEKAVAASHHRPFARSMHRHPVGMQLAR